MSGKGQGGGGRNLANVALMSSPYAAVVAVQTAAAVGPAAVVGGGVAAGALAARTALRRRETPVARARRELRRAARAATSRTVGTTSKRRKGSAAGSLPRLGRKNATGAGRKAGTGRKAGHGHKAAAGHGRVARMRSKGAAGTGLLERKTTSRKHPTSGGHGKSGHRSRATTARHGSTGNSTGPARRPLGRSGAKSRFGHGPRATAARNHLARKRRVGLLGGGINSSRRKPSVPRRNRMKSHQPVSRRWFGTAHPADRRNAAARAARRRRSLMRSGMWSKLGKLKTTRGARTMRASWAPLRRALRRRGGSPLGRVVLVSAGMVWGVLGTTAGAAMLLPRMMSALRVLGLLTHREVSILRSAVAAWLNPFDADAAAEPIKAKTSNNRTNTGGNTTMATGNADHLEALIEHIKNAGQIERFVGLDVEAHAHAVARVLQAIGEYLAGSVDLIKENLPQLDGGESLVQQVDLVASAALGASECADAFTDVHEDRLKRQREPEQGEENWDVAAVRD